MHDPNSDCVNPSENISEEKDWHFDEIIPLNKTELKNRILNHKKECNCGCIR